MFIEYGLNEYDELVYVEQVARGITNLKCPYCGGQLLARKGEVKVHHFAHVGDTCAAAERDPDAIALPCYDNFNLHLSGRALQELHNYHDIKPYSHTLLEELELITYDRYSYSGGYTLTKKGKIPLGELSLMLFCEFQEPLIRKRHDHLEQMVRQSRGTIDFDLHLTDLRLYRAQWRRLLLHTLYFLKIEVSAPNPQTLYKIGVTARPLEQRLVEISDDVLSYIGEAKITPLRTYTHRGNVELYFKHRYKAFNANIEPLTEYYSFDDDTFKKVQRDLARMKSKEALDYLEQSVITGELSDIEKKISFEATESRRRERISKGMRRAAEQGRAVGRPKGSVEAVNLLEKYPQVVEALKPENRLSLRQAAAYAGVSVNTVRKVQAALKANYEL